MARNPLLLMLLGSVTAVAFSSAHGASLTVEITDARGRAVPDAVVVATGIGIPVAAAQPSKPAVMDQVDKAFVPNILVVRSGQSVIFPNSDSVAHQVYSFSAAKRFELPLYRGQAHPPITLAQAGLIVLGCNIHDSMVGYIYVTDSPYFGTSNRRGQWQMDGLPAASYEVTVWSSRLPRGAAQIQQRVTLDDAVPAVTHVRLKDTLRPGAGAAQDPRVRDY